MDDCLIVSDIMYEGKLDGVYATGESLHTQLQKVCFCSFIYLLTFCEVTVNAGTVNLF